MSNFQIVLFKDKKKRKIIKKFKTLEKANSFYEKYMKNSDDIQFEKEFVEGKKTNYELGLIQIGKSPENYTYLKDELGRNVKILLEDKNMSLLKISSIKIEELIYDYQIKDKISFMSFLKTYLRGKNLKLISGLNNKIVIQEDSDIYVFILKNQNETNRFLDCLSQYLFKNKRADCMIVKDTSITQRKYLYDLLESSGFDKSFLYRKFTARARSK